jgi:hypothetical protein
MALAIGSVISFASMVMASQVGETASASAACDRTVDAARHRDRVAGRKRPSAADRQKRGLTMQPLTRPSNPAPSLKADRSRQISDLKAGA